MSHIILSGAGSGKINDRTAVELCGITPQEKEAGMRPLLEPESEWTQKHLVHRPNSGNDDDNDDDGELPRDAEGETESTVRGDEGPHSDHDRLINQTTRTPFLGQNYGRGSLTRQRAAKRAKCIKPSVRAHTDDAAPKADNPGHGSDIGNIGAAACCSPIPSCGSEEIED